jgi:hypothetical protein
MRTLCVAACYDRSCPWGAAVNIKNIFRDIPVAGGTDMVACADV